MSQPERVETVHCPRCTYAFFHKPDPDTYQCKWCRQRYSIEQLMGEAPVPPKPVRPICPACHAPDPVFYFARKDRRAGEVVIRTSYGCLACRASFTIARPAPTD